MAKSDEGEKPKKHRKGKYDERLVVNGSFMDIINAAVKHTKANTPKKKKP